MGLQRAPARPSASRRAVALAGAMLVGIVLTGAVMAARTHSSASNVRDGQGPDRRATAEPQ